MGAEVRELEKEGRRDIKIAFATEGRIRSVAEHDGMIVYGEPDSLRTHYLNTGRQIRNMNQQTQEIIANT